MSDYPALSFAAAYLAMAVAVWMFQLGAWFPREPRWLLPLSAVVAVPMAYYMVASTTHWPLPDPENWTAIGTVVIALTALVGVGFGLSTLRALREEGLQNARQTAVLVEQAWPHLEVVTNQLPVLQKNLGIWRGQVVYAMGTTAARDIDVWLREPAGYYFATFNLVLPGRTVNFALNQAVGQLIERNPFRVLDDAPLPGQAWIGVVWRCPDGDFRYQLMAFTFNAQDEIVEGHPNRRDRGFRLRLSGLVHDR